MLYFFREALEVKDSTVGRRIYGYVSAIIVLAVAVGSILVGTSPWFFVVIGMAGLSLDFFLVRSWINKKLLLDATESR